jgi:hypothetical protein
VLGLAAGAALVPIAVSGGRAEAAPGGAPDQVFLPDGIRPEGITSGPGLTYYVGSLADGRIVTGNLRTGTVRTLLPGATGRAIRGLYWDARTGWVWAVGNVGTVSHVWAVDGDTGAIGYDRVIPGADFLNDLVVTRRRVYVTDSGVDRLTVIGLGQNGRPTPNGLLAYLPLNGEWPAGDGQETNANGIRELWDGSLILNNSRVGGLWRVDPETGYTTEIPVSGGPGLTAGDGLELRGPVLYDVRGSGQDEVSVLRLSRSGPGWRATWQDALTAPSLDVPSTATAAGPWLWAVNARFGTPNPGTATYSITRLPLRP